MSAYATLEDLKARLGEDSIPAGLEPIVEQNLIETSAYINAYLSVRGKSSESIDPENLKSVNCNLTTRWLNGIIGTIPEGAISTSTTVGDFSQSATFVKPSSTTNFELSQTDRLLLGLRNHAGSYYMGADRG